VAWRHPKVHGQVESCAAAPGTKVPKAGWPPQSGGEGEAVLVLHDYHLIDSGPVAASVAFC